MRTRMLLSPVAAGALMIGCAGGAGLPTDAGSREAAPTDAPMTRHDAMADAKKHDATSGVDGSEGKADSGADAGRGTGIDAGRDAASVKDTGADARADAGRDGGSGKDARTDTGSRDAGRDSSSETDAGARTDGRLDAKASDSGERDAKTLDAAVADAGGACGATCAANQACQNGSCVYVDPASTVTCTFTTSNDTTNPQCGPPCALPAPATITQVNVPVYITEGCTIADEVQSPETYGVVIDAPRIWAAWVAASGAGPGPGASLCLGTWPITPSDLIAEPDLSAPHSSFSGSVILAGDVASVTLSGSVSPGDVCGGVDWGCIYVSYSCSGSATALLSSCYTNSGGCDPNATCTPTGSTSNICTCNTGYTGNGTTCAPVPNPCLANNGGCDPNATCTDNLGTAECTCNTGYTGNGTTCVAIP